MKKKNQKLNIRFGRAADQGCTVASVKTWTKTKLLKRWKGAVDCIEVAECFDVADCQIRSITENELLRRDSDLEVEDLYRKYYPDLADKYS